LFLLLLLWIPYFDLSFRPYFWVTSSKLFLAHFIHHDHQLLNCSLWLPLIPSMSLTSSFFIETPEFESDSRLSIPLLIITVELLIKGVCNLCFSSSASFSTHPEDPLQPNPLQSQNLRKNWAAFHLQPQHLRVFEKNNVSLIKVRWRWYHRFDAIFWALRSIISLTLLKWIMKMALKLVQFPYF